MDVESVEFMQIMMSSKAIIENVPSQDIRKVLNYQQYPFTNQFCDPVKQQFYIAAAQYLRTDILPHMKTLSEIEKLGVEENMVNILKNLPNDTTVQELKNILYDWAKQQIFDYSLMQNFQNFNIRKNQHFKLLDLDKNGVNFDNPIHHYEPIALIPELKQTYDLATSQLKLLLQVPSFIKSQDLRDQSGQQLLPKDLPEILKKNYIFEGRLGEGGYSQVYRFFDKQAQKSVAVKIINLFYHQNDTKRVLREIYIQKQLWNSNVLTIRNIIYNKDEKSFDKIYIILDYMPFTLYDLIYKYFDNITWSHELIRIIFTQIMSGLSYLRSRNILHRDIKPDNILIDENLNVRIADFTLSRSSLSHESYYEVIKQNTPQFKMYETKSFKAGSRWYRSPEIILINQAHSFPSDMWSVGCLFAEMLQTCSRKIPFKPLFQGDFCQPISPRKDNTNEQSTKQDQLQIILSALGIPSIEDCDFIEKPEMLAYLYSFKANPQIPINQMFSNLKLEEQFILKNLLKFSPEKRLTDEQIMSLDYCNIFNRQDVFYYKNNPIFVDFELHGNSQQQSRLLSLEQYRLLFIREFEFYYGISQCPQYQMQINEVLSYVKAFNHRAMVQM